MRIKHTVVALITGALLVVGLPLTTAPAAAAVTAAACRGASCSGKNPQAMGCGKDARTIDRIRPAGGGPRVELRRSRACRASWARIQVANPSWRFKLKVKNGAVYRGNASLEYRAYTLMTGSRKPYRACVKNYGGPGWSCTRWH